MTRLEIDAAPKAAEFIEQVVSAMVRLFGMSRDEAVGRVNRHWRGQEFRRLGKRMALYHQAPDWWAKTITYGRDSEWWLDEENAQPEPYP